MKVALAQINTTPGDFSGNLDRVRRGLEEVGGKADLIVFPELTLPGYLSQDLIYNPAYVARNLEALDQVKAMSAQLAPQLTIVLGYLDWNAGGGKPFRNLAGVLRNGELLATYQKQLLPFYDVFDELRYFEPGDAITQVEVAGYRVGIAICEDLWNDKDTDDYNYANNPLAQYRQAGVDLVVSLNSSPYVKDKCLDRLRYISPSTLDGPAVVYVNQIGGQDELVFDGKSFVVKENQLIYLSDTLYEDSYDLVDLNGPVVSQSEVVPQSEVVSQGRVNPALAPRQASLESLLILGLRDYALKSGFGELALASSGGVDSALVAKLACEAVGPRHVHAIRMPSVFSSGHSRQDAQKLHENLGCWDYEVPIDHGPLVEMLAGRYGVHGDPSNLVASRSQSGTYNQVADENIQARLRDVYLMHFSNAYGAMPLSTGNKTESGCGYYTHFDMNFSYAPIKDLYKFQVVQLAKADPRIPENIWRKPPSAELAPGQVDEASLLPYAALDPIVMAYIEHYVTSFERFTGWVDEALTSGQAITGDDQALRAWLGQESAKEDYRRIVNLIGMMEYKRRQTCPGTKVSKVAFGIGRRIPLVEKWSREEW